MASDARRDNNKWGDDHFVMQFGLLVVDGLRLLHDFSMEVSLQLFPLRTYARGRLMFCSWFCSMERKKETTVGNII